MPSSPTRPGPQPGGDSAALLAVSYLVEGSVRQTVDRIRVTAQLVDARQGRVLLVGPFDEPLADVFTLQDNISAQIVSAMALRVTQIEQRRVLAKPTESLEAYDYVLRARPASQHPTRANVAEARTPAQRAIDLDPELMRPHTPRLRKPITSRLRWMGGIAGRILEPRRRIGPQGTQPR